MSAFSIITVRLALAYLIIVNSIDMISSDSLLPSVYPAGVNSWLTNPIWFAASINIVGGILLASGWRLKFTALVLVASMALFVVVYQEPVAVIITGGLLVVAWRACTASVPVANRGRVSNAMNEVTGSVAGAKRCCG